MSLKIKNKQIAIVSEFDINNQRLINVQTPIDNLDAVNKMYVKTTASNHALGTGLYLGGNFEVVDDTHFNVYAGIGYKVNPSTKLITEVIWNDHLNVPIMAFGSTDVTVSLAIDENGNIFQQIPKFNALQRNTYIVLGEIIIHPTTRVLLPMNGYFPVLSRDLPSVYDLHSVDGPKNESGNNVTPNGANLQLNVTSGKFVGYSINASESLDLPNERSYPLVTGITFWETRFNGTEWIYTDAVSSVVPGYWSNGTATLQTSTPSKYNLRIILRYVGEDNVFLLGYPTQTQQYDNIIDAESDLYSLGVNIPDELFGITVPLAYVIVRGNATNLSDPTQSKIVPIQSISTAAGSIATNAGDVSYDSSGAVNLTDNTVQDAITTVNNKIESFDYSYANEDMTANSGVSGTYLATNTAIIDVPATLVRVNVNGLKATVGNGIKTKDCFFSADGGTTAKTFSNVAQGDYLYWSGNTALYQLETTDKIDFIYMKM